jgi:RNA polymerase sigma-70 factor (ECF subfamily)
MDEGQFVQILQAAQAGRRAAIASLYRGFNPILVTYLRARAPGVAEDVAHETWLAVSEELREFRGDESAFRVWLISIARTQLAGERASIPSVHASTVEPGRLAKITPIREPEDVRVADAAIAQLLAGLPPSHAEILLLRVVGGLSAEEAGALVGKTPGAVRVIQHRALRKLAKRLSDDRVAQ